MHVMTPKAKRRETAVWLIEQAVMLAVVVGGICGTSALCGLVFAALGVNG